MPKTKEIYLVCPRCGGYEVEISIDCPLREDRNLDPKVQERFCGLYIPEDACLHNDCPAPKNTQKAVQEARERLITKSARIRTSDYELEK